MDNMKARAWVESETPLWRLGDATIRAWIEQFIVHAVAAADTVARLLTGAVKSALHDRPADARGDYGFIGERFYRETEGAFYTALGEAALLIDENPDADDPTLHARENWAPVLSRAALGLFDEYAPAEGLEGRDHASVRQGALLSDAGIGRAWQVRRALFDGALGIAAPETVRARKSKEVA